MRRGRSAWRGPADSTARPGGEGERARCGVLVGDFHARVTTTWLVNSEGTIVRKSAAEYQEGIGVGTQAADGMRLDRSYSSTGSSLKDLDAAQDFEKHAVGLLASLTDLRKAPLVEEEYHGPVLLSSDASADTMRSLIASGVTATRPKLGTEARTNGPFASSYHARVLPDFLDVVDDPVLKSFDGKGLVGAYAVDDEGVPAQAVNLITAGKLESYLVGREPVKDFPQSNGHGRAGITEQYAERSRRQNTTAIRRRRNAIVMNCLRFCPRKRPSAPRRAEFSL